MLVGSLFAPAKFRHVEIYPPTDLIRLSPVKTNTNTEQTFNEQSFLFRGTFGRGFIHAVNGADMVQNGHKDHSNALYEGNIFCAQVAPYVLYSQCTACILHFLCSEGVAVFCIFSVSLELVPREKDDLRHILSRHITQYLSATMEAVEPFRLMDLPLDMLFEVHSYWFFHFCLMSFADFHAFGTSRLGSPCKDQ